MQIFAHILSICQVALIGVRVLSPITTNAEVRGFDSRPGHIISYPNCFNDSLKLYINSQIITKYKNIYITIETPFKRHNNNYFVHVRIVTMHTNIQKLLLLEILISVLDVHTERC